MVCLFVNRDDSIVNLDAGGNEGGVINTLFRDSDVVDG
jgi:hypothetical protein